MYIIEKLQTKIFINNYILNSEMMVANIGKTNSRIENCKNMTFKFNVRNIGPLFKRMVRFNGVIKIPAKFISIIPFNLRDKNGGMPSGRDIMFIPKNWSIETTMVFFLYRGCIYGHNTDHEHQYRKRLLIKKQQIKFRSKLWKKIAI